MTFLGKKYCVVRNSRSGEYQVQLIAGGAASWACHLSGHDFGCVIAATEDGWENAKTNVLRALQKAIDDIRSANVDVNDIPVYTPQEEQSSIATIHERGDIACVKRGQAYGPLPKYWKHQLVCKGSRLHVMEVYGMGLIQDGSGPTAVASDGPAVILEVLHDMHWQIEEQAVMLYLVNASMLEASSYLERAVFRDPEAPLSDSEDGDDEEEEEEEEEQEEHDGNGADVAVHAAADTA
jgi:hypothetical protein